MKMFFVDNFRGFSETYIPIKDVNFLVGENSTGKTSILTLLKPFTSPYFWIQSEVNTPEVNLGHFGDIVSVDSADRSYFSAGVIETTKTKENTTENVRAVLMSFREQSGLPRPVLYARSDSDSELLIWNDWKLIHFFDSTGFSPAKTLSLEVLL